ncbi:MAG: hypothetical protein OXG58_02045 [Gemmatimonadetes bacterium]|nr:hypothetical protein [Gemmatimonadota bacterium]MCY3943079.1 hypothetical protein [Gemmatimonadota bacterium]
MGTRFQAIAATCALSALVALTARPAAGQATGLADSLQEIRPSVFLDCATRGCRPEYFRTEIGWVNWVRLPDEADVHLILTSQATGAGGREYRLDFMGTGDFEYEERVLHRALPTATDREILDGLVRAIGVGVLHFATRNGLLPPSRFREIAESVLSPDAGTSPGVGVVGTAEVDDPWDFWVFRVGGGTDIQGEETRRTVQLSGDLRASRVTPELKAIFRANVDSDLREIELADDSTFRDRRTDWGFSALVAQSLADRWSVGFRTDLRRSLRYNQSLRAEATAALEHSFFPYAEATRRALTISYEIAATYRQYVEQTIYSELAETRWEHSLEAELARREKWGDIAINVEGSHFLHDVELYGLSCYGGLDFRIARGVTIDLQANISWVNDQIYLSAEGLSDAEALLDLQQQAQNFNYGIEAGLSFHFGSIFNNVVNNRFRRGRWR